MFDSTQKGNNTGFPTLPSYMLRVCRGGSYAPTVHLLMVVNHTKL